MPFLTDVVLSPSASESPLPQPQTPRRPRIHLTRDDRVRVLLTLHSIPWTYKEIANHLHISQCAVQYTCENNVATPKK